MLQILPNDAGGRDDPILSDREPGLTFLGMPCGPVQRYTPTPPGNHDFVINQGFNDIPINGCTYRPIDVPQEAEERSPIEPGRRQTDRVRAL
eukprot:3215805-Prymnesium_polylepis.3